MGNVPRPSQHLERDKNMVDTLDNLLVHFERRHENPKVAMWAHNLHLGDARATQMARRGELNVGQLVRELHPGEVVLVGFTTHSGSVTAASEWGGVTERKQVLPGLEGSFEQLFHECEIGNFMLRFDEHPELHRPLNSGKLERAIGVIYLPETERSSHYFFADLADQFDLALHYDESRVVERAEHGFQFLPNDPQRPVSALATQLFQPFAAMLPTSWVSAS